MSGMIGSGGDGCIFSVQMSDSSGDVASQGYCLLLNVVIEDDVSVSSTFLLSGYTGSAKGTNQR